MNKETHEVTEHEIILKKNIADSRLELWVKSILKIHMVALPTRVRVKTPTKDCILTVDRL